MMLLDEGIKQIKFKVIFWFYNRRESDIPCVCKLERGKGWSSFTMNDICTNEETIKNTI